MAISRCCNCGELYNSRRKHCPECDSIEIDENDKYFEDVLTNKELADIMRLKDIDNELVSANPPADIFEEMEYGKES